MTRAEWNGMPRRKQLRVLRHMQVATVSAMSLTYTQIERMLSAMFEAEYDCTSKKPCAACRFGWTKPVPRKRKPRRARRIIPRAGRTARATST